KVDSRGDFFGRRLGAETGVQRLLIRLHIRDFGRLSAAERYSSAALGAREPQSDENRDAPNVRSSGLFGPPLLHLQMVQLLLPGQLEACVLDYFARGVRRYTGRFPIVFVYKTPR